MLNRNRTQTTHNMIFDEEGKVVIYLEPGIAMNHTMAFLKVPEEFNIFTFLNVTEQPEDPDGWMIALRLNETRHITLGGLFDVSTNDTCFNL